jgi:hypothetical protein
MKSKLFVFVPKTPTGAIPLLGGMKSKLFVFVPKIPKCAIYVKYQFKFKYSINI